MSAPVAIVDCNNFYASCERAFNPKLRGKPIVVLSNNDGMIIARSDEAKALGIPMAEPLFKIKDLIAKHDIKVFSSNYTLYGDMSHRVMTILEQFSPNVEIYSIDEAFLNFEGLQRLDFTKYAFIIRKTVRKWTGIPVSVGIAETKTLAKLANRFAKKNKKTEGVMNLINNPDIDFYLKKTAVEDVWGVGRQYTKLLYMNNIFTAFDLKNANDEWIRKKMTVMGLRTVFELRGIPCVNFDYAPPPKKSIVSSRSFGRLVREKNEIREAISFFITRAAEKLRSQKSAATMLTVFLRTNPFKKTPQYHNGCLVKLPVPTDSTSEMIQYGMKGVEQIFRQGFEYYKVGVMLAGIVPFDRSQLPIFDTEDRIRSLKITDAMDVINAEMGTGTIFYAATGVHRGWKTKVERRTPDYTTDWEGLPGIKTDFDV